MTTEAETEVMRSQVQECRQPPWEATGHRSRCSHPGCRGTAARLTLILAQGS